MTLPYAPDSTRVEAGAGTMELDLYLWPEDEAFVTEMRWSSGTAL